MWVTQAEAARHPQVKVSKQRINALVQQGRLKVNDRKQVDLGQVLEEFKRGLHPSWDGNPLVEQPQRGSDADEPGDDAGEEAKVEQPEYKQALTKIKLTDAKIKEFEYQRMLGMYLPKADVDRAQEAAARKLRQLLDTIPHMAGEIYSVARSGAEEDVRRLLKAKMRQFEQGFADAMLAAARQGADAVGA